MPDLRNAVVGHDINGNPITLGANYRRAENRFSNYGTRRLQFYTIEVGGYDATTEPDTMESDNNFNSGSNNTDDYAYKNSPTSIIEGILRGVALVAEPYYVSWWHVEYDGEYPYTYITVAVAADTVVDADSNWFTHNSLSITDSIAGAIADFEWEYVNAFPAEIYGQNLSEDNAPYALSAAAKKAPIASGSEARAARKAAGKNGVKKK